MRKTRILIASVLKPVNDTRMFEKIGQSLAKLPETVVHVAGFSAKGLSNFPNIVFHPIFSFPRLSLGRLAAQWKYYKLLTQVKPEVIVANTFELLPVSVLYRIIHGCLILYDVRENYYANIRFQPTFAKPLRWLLAHTVRLIEKGASNFVLHFFLAERTYSKELPFLKKGNFTILENKFRSRKKEETTQTTPVLLQANKLHFLYSGTISEVYGILEAIDLVKALQKIEPGVTLTIIGFCAQPETLQKVQQAIADHSFITLIGGAAHVPHPEIVQAIREAHVGLLPYRLNESTRNCLPTKMFEYQANALPMLIPRNQLWETIVEAAGAGISIDFTRFSAKDILNRLTTTAFYPGGIPEDVFWQEEEEKMLSVMRLKVLNNLNSN